MSMDLFVYVAILLVFGFAKVRSTSDVPDTVTVADTTTVPSSDLPLGNNLQMRRELGAYTLILRQLGLM